MYLIFFAFVHQTHTDSHDNCLLGVVWYVMMYDNNLCYGNKNRNRVSMDEERWGLYVDEIEILVTWRL